MLCVSGRGETVCSPGHGLYAAIAQHAAELHPAYALRRGLSGGEHAPLAGGEFRQRRYVLACLHACIVYIIVYKGGMDKKLDFYCPEGISMYPKDVRRYAAAFFKQGYSPREATRMLNGPSR